MSKKLLTFITLVVLTLVIGGGGTFLYLYTKSQNSDGTPSTVGETLKKMNPFGSSVASEVKNVVNKVIPNTFTSSSTDETTASGTGLSPVLFKLSNERSSGIGFADILIPTTIEVRKKILIDDPLTKPGTKPKKISVMATSTETAYSTTTRIRFVEQGTGHIYEYDYASTTMRKLTNTTIPRTQESIFLNNGSKVLMRYIDSTGTGVENYLATIPVSSVTDGLTGDYLNGNIKDVAVSPDTKQFFYIAKTKTGSVGNIYDVVKGTERRIFSSSFSEWLPDWKGSNIYLTTKAHSSFAGVVYAQNTLKESFSKILGSTYGLTSNVSPDGKKILVGSGLYLTIIDIQSGVKANVTTLYTLPEKCVWYTEDRLLCFGQETQPEGSYPEWWYQGRMSFNDALYTVDPTTGEAVKLATPSELYKDTIYMDAVDIQVSKNKKYLVFINKLDMSPWYLDIDTLLTYLEGQE